MLGITLGVYAHTCSIMPSDHLALLFVNQGKMSGQLCRSGMDMPYTDKHCSRSIGNIVVPLLQC